MVKSKLRAIDPVTFLRFASVCDEFQDIKDFESVIKEIEKEKQEKSNE